MDQENKNNKGNRTHNKPFPPKLSITQIVFLIISYVTLVLAVLYLADQLCWRILPPCICCTYIGFGIVLAMFIVDRLIRHECSVHKKCLVDISFVDALFVEAKTVQPTLVGLMADEKHFRRKKTDMLKEVRRLKKLGNQSWTEYQVLSLNQMLVEFLKPDELIARAQSSLEDLEDYAKSSAYGGYDQKQYDKWKGRINEAINKIEAITKKDREFSEFKEDFPSYVEVQREDATKMLKAVLPTLLEHVATYQTYWAEGSAILYNGLMMVCLTAIPLFVVMGLLPLYHRDNGTLGWFNWGLLAIVGALSTLFLRLHRSDLVEIGNTEGTKELWRAVLGATLAFVAGIVTYWMIAGKVLHFGGIVPKLDSSLLNDVGLSILWSVGSGFCFERIFDRLISATVGGN